MDVDRRDLETACRDAARQMGIIQIMLTFGPLAFLGVVLYLGQRENLEPPGDVSIVQTLSLVHGLLLVVSLPVSLFLLPTMLTNSRQLARCGQLEGLQAARCLVGGVMGRAIARIAVLEGVALFGLVVCLLGVLNGAMEEQPLYWLNAASLLVLVAVSLATFPTAERLEGEARRLLERL